MSPHLTRCRAGILDRLAQAFKDHSRNESEYGNAGRHAADQCGLRSFRAIYWGFSVPFGPWGEARTQNSGFDPFHAGRSDDGQLDCPGREGFRSAWGRRQQCSESARRRASASRWENGNPEFEAGSSASSWCGNRSATEPAGSIGSSFQRREREAGATGRLLWKQTGDPFADLFQLPEPLHDGGKRSVAESALVKV